MATHTHTKMIAKVAEDTHGYTLGTWEHLRHTHDLFEIRNAAVTNLMARFLSSIPSSFLSHLNLL
jgi:hypothetical protein